MSKILLNIIEKDTSILNNLDQTYIWNSINTKFKDLFIDENFDIYEINDSLNFRPDIVSYKVYDNDFYYPIILMSNNINSIMQFKTSLIGTNIKYLKIDKLQYLINKL